MKKYYLFGSIAAVVAFLITLMITCISQSCVVNKCKKEVENIGNNVITLRYYADDDFDHAEVIYMQITNREDYKIDFVPTKKGYIFSGLYDKPDFKTATQYVDGNGYNLVPLVKDVLLYPIFVEEK